MELDFWASTDVGRVRDHNEDNFLVDKKLNLFVVCDGMGGHAAGEVASAISVRVVREVVAESRELFEELSGDPHNPDLRKKVLNVMEHAITEACARVWRSAQEDEAKRGMGTTCSMLLLTEGHGFIGHVGDSRIYLYRQNQVHQLTEDHSLANEMIRLGKIKRGEEHNLPHRNAVTRAVGVNESVEVDTFELDLFAGDAFMVCSDGLSGYFKTDDDIVDLMKIEDPKEVTQTGIDFANEGGGKDNITSIAIHVRGGDIKPHEFQMMVDVIRTTPYFQYLSYKEVVRIINLSRREEFEPSERIFNEREDPERMFLIVNGSVKLTQGDQVIKTVEAGDSFGEMAVIDERPQPYAASATEPTVTLSIARDAILEMMRVNPKLAVKLLWNFVQTLAIRFQQVPIDFWLKTVPVEEQVEPTPPRGMVLSDATVETDIKDLDHDKLRKSSRGKPGPTSPEPTDPMDAKETLLDLGEEVRDLFGGDDSFLRETVDDVMNTMGSGAQKLTVPRDPKTHKSLSHDFMESEPTVSEVPLNARPLSRGISGESVVGDSMAPKSQVIRRTKTGEAPSIPANKKRDPTLEIDISDDNVEEIS